MKMISKNGQRFEVDLYENEKKEWGALYCDTTAPVGSRSMIEYKEKTSKKPIVSKNKNELIKSLEKYFNI